MANRTSRLTGSDHQPDPRPDSNRCAVTREQARHGALDPKRRTGPRANRFQRINTLGESLLPPELVELVFSANVIYFSAFRASLAFDSHSFHVKDSESTFPASSMAPPQRRTISLRTVTPSIPENPIELEELKEDLRRMRCARLLERPWELKREELVRKLVQPERPNIFDKTIRDRPQIWTAELWRDTYNFSSGGAGLSNWMDGYIEGRFIHQVDPKDGYAVGDCQKNRQCRVLEFLIPIVHPDKPTRVTITIGNTIFEALDEGREVDWGVVFCNLAQRLAKGVGKPKPTSICPFLFHLYDRWGLLTEDEELDYRTAKEMAGYRITSDPDSRPGSDDERAMPTPVASPV